MKGGELLKVRDERKRVHKGVDLVIFSCFTCRYNTRLLITSTDIALSANTPVSIPHLSLSNNGKKSFLPLLFTAYDYKPL